MARIVIHGHAFIAGSTHGTAIVSSEPISFWGGYDWKTGEIIDRRHPLSGMNAGGRILAIPFTRGSSTTSEVLLEAIRAGTAPCAIITTRTDFFFALASVVADELFARTLPLVAVAEADFACLKTGDDIQIEVDGTVNVLRED